MQKNPHARGLGIAKLAGAAIGCLLLDLLTKHFFFWNASLYAPLFRPVERIITLTQFHNMGATFNIPLPVWLLILASLGFVVWLLMVLLRIPQWWLHHPTLFSGGLIIGGAFGNLFDRFSLGYVRDWILIGQLSALNFADLFVILGSIGLVITLAKFPSRQRA